MAVGQINSTFEWNGKPQNGATAKLWQRYVFYTEADSGDTVQDNPLLIGSVIVNVVAGGTFAAGDLIKVENEHMLVISIAANALTIQRGYDNTAPAQHVQTTVIYDLTQADPDQDDAEPGAGQQGASVTTGVTYGGDGAYRWTDVPDGEYFVSVEYDGHRAWLHAAVESRNTLSQILKLAGDLPYRGTDAIERLPKGANDEYLKLIAGLPVWAVVPGTGIANSKVTTSTRLLNAASGDVGYVGVGFVPHCLFAFACIADSEHASWGFCDNTFTSGGLDANIVGGETVFDDNTQLIRVYDNSGTQSAIVDSWDADGFTLTWTHVAAGGAVNIQLIFLSLK